MIVRLNNISIQMLPSDKHQHISPAEKDIGPHLSIVRTAEDCAQPFPGIYQSGHERTSLPNLTSGLTLCTHSASFW